MVYVDLYTILHVAYILTPLYLLSYNVEGSAYTYMSNGFECDMCPPGTHWIADCKNGNRRSECRNCPDGTYSETYNTASSCEPCLKEGHCPQGTVLIKACRATSNNRCECPDGEYWVIILGGDGACEPHRTCNENEVVVKKGNGNEDTQCEPKPVDPTSNGEDKKDPTGEHHPVTTLSSIDDLTTQLPPGNEKNEKDPNGKENPGPEDDDDDKEGLGNLHVILIVLLGLVALVGSVIIVILCRICIKNKNENQSDTVQSKPVTLEPLINNRKQNNKKNKQKKNPKKQNR